MVRDAPAPLLGTMPQEHRQSEMAYEAHWRSSAFFPDFAKLALLPKALVRA